jgi:uncharacterized membrane protein HdeD (DUF308 family)
MRNELSEPNGSMVETILSERWWAFALRGVAAVLFGILTWALPAESLLSLVFVWGAFALIDGGFAIAAAARTGREGGRWGWFLFEGLASITAGVVTFVWPGITGLVLLYTIAIWAVVTGIAQVGAAIRLRSVIKGEWLLGLSGVLSVVFGAVMFARPLAGAIGLAWMIGAYAVTLGVLLIGLSVKLRRLRPQGSHSVPTESHPTPA